MLKNPLVFPLLTFFLMLSFSESHPEKTNFDMNIVLTCDQPWVSHPSHLNCTNMPRTISIRIDPSSLSTGVHTARYLFYI